ncbi:putative xylosidase/glycosyl hydrolase [Cladochytrium replicatum]|nr:putative xylosidase/glycosyl hydrolase [Cladochytrium replicatum]
MLRLSTTPSSGMISPISMSFVSVLLTTTALPTMHYSPGAPILKSDDLVNWEYVGHAVPSLAPFGSKYDLTNGQSGYVRGIWASFFNYRASTNTWYWGGCVDFAQTHIFTASSPSGPWSRKSVINKCYYDAGLLVDTDNTLYVAYGNTQISVAQLSSDGLSEVRSQVVYSAPSSIGTIEGSRFYKVNGRYYIFVTHPAAQELVLMSTSGPFGPYTIKNLVNSVRSPVSGSGFPHQGGIVSTPNNQWYYMSFIDAYPGGRIPVLAPITWGSDGFPSVTLSNGGWGASYDYPVAQASAKLLTGTDTFASFGPEWEWNHNPDNTKWSLNSGIVLQTATVTNDIYRARNTLTRRILGPSSTGTIILDFANMAAGDRAGLALFRDKSAYIGIKKEGSSTYVVMVNSINMASDWSTSNTGVEVARQSVSGSRIWLSIAANIAPGGNKQATFSYSLDGNSFVNFGSAFTMNSDWQFFMGYRFGIFNHATSALGGSVTVRSFTLCSGLVKCTTSAPGGGGGGTPTTTTTTTTRTVTTSAPATTTSPSSGGGGNCAAKYGQCGGQNWTGPKCCVAGSTCTFSNDYYSQCL